MKDTPLLKVCGLLNKSRVKYAVIGEWATALHGIPHCINNIELLIEDSVRNVKKMINTLKHLKQGIITSYTPEEIEKLTTLLKMEYKSYHIK